MIYTMCIKVYFFGLKNPIHARTCTLYTENIRAFFPQGQQTVCKNEVSLVIVRKAGFDRL